MTLTVVMSTYNSAESITGALQSIQRQTYQDWLLLVVDDAATDDTPGLLDAAARADDRVRVITNRWNVGLAQSLNRALHEVQTPLVARMDDDDISEPDRLRLQVERMDQDPSIDVLGTGVVLVDEQGDQIGVDFPPATHAELARAMYRRSPFYHPTVLYRRSFIERAGGYDARFRRGQDQDLWLRTYRHSCFANLQDPLVTYRVRSTLSWNSAGFGAYALGRNAWRERSPLKSWYAARYLAAAVGARLRSERNAGG